jgi:BioD-like phosphotransacetylase family protein
MVDEIIDALEPQVLTDCITSDILVEHINVGAMNAEAAISRLRRSKNNAVITGGDRVDIQITALETNSACLILTGCLEPRSLIVKQANEMGIPILLVDMNTMETVEAVDRIFGRTRMGQTVKLEKFQKLLAEHMALDRMYQCIGLG